ncbi:hypothetical protein [Deinococcus hopiensis]|uniref:hypothetical protein n=1 Tax=Deinococcus hopiensis TaxID=309885 RepID=UPI000A02B087
MAQAEKEARRRGFPEVVLDSGPDALPFYERLGLVRREHRPCTRRWPSPRRPPLGHPPLNPDTLTPCPVP